MSHLTGDFPVTRPRNPTQECGVRALADWLAHPALRSIAPPTPDLARRTPASDRSIQAWAGSILVLAGSIRRQAARRMERDPDGMIGTAIGTAIGIVRTTACPTGRGIAVAMATAFGWYLSPYVLGYPSTFDYDNSGSYADNMSNPTSNPVPYADNYGARQPYGDYGSQGYGPDPGYQSPNYQPSSYSPPQPGRQLYAPSSAPVESAAAIKPEAPVTLIFNDGRPPEHIHNYLLTSTKLTVLDATYREIPLDQINIAATEEANRSAGIDFRVPHGSSGKHPNTANLSLASRNVRFSEQVKCPVFG